MAGVELNIKTKVDISNAEKATDTVEKAAKKSGDAVGGLTSQLDKMTNGAISGFTGIAKSIKKGILGIKTFKTLVASTGIGLLIAAVGSLVAYFTQTERGAEKLKVITAALGGVFGSVTDRVIAMGEYLVEAFSNPKQVLVDLGDTFAYYFTEFIPNAVQQVIDGFGMLGTAIGLLFDGEFSKAAEVAAEGFIKVADGVTDLNPTTAIIKSITEEVVEMGSAAIETAKNASGLAERMNDLIRAERDLGVERANSRSEIKKLNKDAEDTTKSYKERAEAASKASAIEEGLMAKQIQLATERRDIIREQNALTESSPEDLQKLADAEIALANIRTESLELQTTLQNKLNILNEQSAAETATKAEEKRLEALLETDNKIREEKLKGEEAELQRLLEFYQRQRDLELQELDLTEAEKEAIRLSYKEKEAEEKKKIDDKILADKKKTDAEELSAEEAKSNAIKSTVNSVFQIGAALGAKSVKASKAVAAAKATYDTYAAITGALRASQASPGAAIPGYAIAQAVATGAFGLLQVKKILSTNPSTSAPSASGAGGSGGAASTPTVPDFNFVNQGVGNTDNSSLPTARAYVVNQDIKDQSSLDSRINDLAKI